MLEKIITFVKSHKSDMRKMLWVDISIIVIAVVGISLNIYNNNANIRVELLKFFIAVPAMMIMILVGYLFVLKQDGKL